MSVFEHVFENSDSTNDLALFLASGVVPTVLLEVTLGSGRFNLLDDVSETRTF